MNNQYTTTQTKTSEFDEGLRKFMLGVYNYMSLGLAATAVIAMIFITNPALTAMFQGKMMFLPFIGIMILGFVAPKVIYSGSAVMAHGAYWLYVGLWGLLIGPSLAIFVGAGLADVVLQAFFITASIFAAVSIFGYTTKKDLSSWGKFLFMASIGLFVVLLLNIFWLQGSFFSILVSSAVVLLISGVTAYETQMLKTLYLNQPSASARHSILGAFMLYGSFVTMFMHILRILMLTRN